MMNIQLHIAQYKNILFSYKTELIAVSKTKPFTDIISAYEAGQRHFGESKVQEIQEKIKQLPKEIEKNVHWHMIGHLQSNKIKALLPSVYLIHSVDSRKLLMNINEQSKKINQQTRILLQIHIAREEQKYGFSYEEVEALIEDVAIKQLSNLQILGLMGIATNTENKKLIEQEFSQLADFFKKLKSSSLPPPFNMQCLSIGMSHDYDIALKFNPTYVRIGSNIFGNRVYHNN